MTVLWWNIFAITSLGTGIPNYKRNSINPWMGYAPKIELLHYRNHKN
jgi:hypothetical protein